MNIVIFSQQKIGDLYDFIITDICNNMGINNTISMQQKLYIDAPVCDFDSVCRKYKIYENRYQNVIFGAPDSINVLGFFGISYPEISYNYLIITTTPFGLSYSKEYKNILFVNSGGTEYFFRYNERIKRWIFIKKKDFGI